jgi:hypothetical protein
MPRQGPSTTDFILNSRDYTFAADVDRIVANTEARMLLVMKQSLINAINEMQTSTAKGGKMRVDTGFLRASGQASLNGMPNGPSVKPKDAAPGAFQPPAPEATIGGMEFGATLFWGWTANYARYREAYDGFLHSTLQNWQQIVDAVIAEAKQRFP